MNIFVPFISLLENAKSLWKDKRRFNKQIIECNQIIKAIEGNKAWRNHPITKMYELNKDWIELYRDCLINYKLFINSTNCNDKQNYSHLLILINRKAKSITPSFLNEKYCIQHRKRLFTKNPTAFEEFKCYGVSNENWYIINGNLIKYINGKRI